jgi:hypothetical protein
LTITNKIKAALLDFYIFQRSATLVCTELWDGFSIADVIVLLKNKVLEIEIKTSIADLKNDLKKGKRTSKYELIDGLYRETNKRLVTKHSIISDGNNYYYTPNKFYFCIPTSLKDKTLEFIQTLNSKYGLIVFDETKSIKECLTFIKRATDLHTFDNTKKYEKKMSDRICNDLTKKYRLLYYKDNK